MKLYNIEINLTLYRTVEVPDDIIELEDIDDYLNHNYTDEKTIKEAIDDSDFEIDKFFWHEVGNHESR